MGQIHSNHDSLSMVGRVVRTLELGHPGAVLHCACSTDERTAAGCSTDNKVLVWDMATGNKLFTLDGHKADVTTCSFCGDLLATSSRDGEVLLWRYKDGKRLSRIAISKCAILCCVISPNGSILALAAEDGRARLYRIRHDAGEYIQGSQYIQLHGHTQPVNDMAVSRDNDFAVTGSSDGTVRKWNVETGKEVLRMQNGTGKVICSRFSNCRDKIISLSRQCLTIWCSKSGEQLQLIQDECGRGYQNMSAHPIDPIVGIACMDGSILIHSISNTQEKIVRRTDHKGPLLNCEFSSKGRLGLTCGIDGKISVWM